MNATHDRTAADVDGHVDRRGVQYIGKATRQPYGTWQCLANVGGALCIVECTVTIEPHNCGRIDCGLKRAYNDPGMEDGDLYYARLVCGHGDWPCGVCSRPVHPAGKCPGK